MMRFVRLTDGDREPRRSADDFARAAWRLFFFIAGVLLLGGALDFLGAL
jgi:hypothetical protein